MSPPRGEEREFATLEPFNGDAHLKVQRLHSAHRALHLDLHVDDLATAVPEASALGATLIAEHPTHAVMRSPAGFDFCLVPWNGSARRSRPIRWPEDTISVIDQVCIDVPAPLFDDEVRFWSTVTEQPASPTSPTGVMSLRRDKRLALGIVLSPITGEAEHDISPQESGPDRVSAHLNIATTSVADEVSRHTEWGAQVLAEFPGWSVMADPFGRRYCITDRNPRTGE